MNTIIKEIVKVLRLLDKQDLVRVLKYSIALKNN